MIRLVALLILSAFSFFASAQQGADIYRVEVSVANQSDAERMAAIKTTLGDVIVHVVGNPDALQNPVVRQAMNEAPNYLAQFSYTSGTVLVLNYSPQAIRTLLQNAQLITVPTNAPQVVMIHVVNVQDFNIFKQVQAYLKTIGIVHRVELVGVNKEDMQINITLNGDAELLKNTLNAAGKLQAVVGDALSPLSFRWQN